MLSPHMTISRDTRRDLMDALDSLGARGYRAVGVRDEGRCWTADLIHEPGARFAHFAISRGLPGDALAFSHVVAVQR